MAAAAAVAFETLMSAGRESFPVKICHSLGSLATIKTSMFVYQALKFDVPLRVGTKSEIVNASGVGMITVAMEASDRQECGKVG